MSIERAMISDFLKESGVDAAFIEKDENCRYISGFTGSDSYLFLTADDCYLLTDSRYTEQAKEEAKGFTIIDYAGKLAKTVGELSIKHHVTRFGIEAGMTYKMYLSFDEVLPEAEFIFVTPDTLRQIKSAEEIGLMQEACRISDLGFEKTVPYIKAGVTEAELRTILECAMLEGGSEGKSFDTIVASGYGGVYPKGMVIGTVEQVDVDSIGGTQVARIVPAADFSHLEEVFIITDHIQRATPESILVKPPKKEPPMNPNKHQAGEKE